MKTTLILIIAIILFQSCSKCDTYPHFTLPNRVKYNSRIVEEIQRYVVTDSQYLLFTRIDNFYGSNSIIQTQYDSFFIKERIETIEFGEKSKATASVYSYNKLFLVYEGTYDLYSKDVNVNVGYPHGDFNLYHNDGSTISFPVAMCFSKKKGPGQAYINFIDGTEDDWHNKDGLIESQIYLSHLSINDTVYLNKINLVYYPY
ncbi:MAG TPA: hypothetical protein VK590_06295 [Saprospiraceae bacterium]|nr:hypothetical protein [Saprospiraceae bacterium]